MAKKLSLLTVSAVKQAMNEADQLGRDVFLKKYGYLRSRTCLLHSDGHVYDSKAIVGVAFGKQFGASLKASEFSGGAATVVPVLQDLGFMVLETPHPAAFLVKGATYYRKDLVERFGGQLQAGIWTPAEFPVVFVFSGDSGKAYGYQDGWDDSGVFQFTGEGQVGDMTFTGGNKAIRDHRENGKDLLLFKDLGKGKGVRYEGLFEAASWREMLGSDRNAQTRKILVFDLVPVGSGATEMASAPPLLDAPVGKSLAELRVAAYCAFEPSQANAKAANAKVSWYERSEQVRSYVLARADGLCEACERPAPFLKKDGTPYLEAHHTHRLADEGPDHPAWVGAICPTCHRLIHSGLDGAAWNQALRKRLEEKESAAHAS